MVIIPATSDDPSIEIYLRGVMSCTIRSQGGRSQGYINYLNEEFLRDLTVHCVPMML